MQLIGYICVRFIYYLKSKWEKKNYARPEHVSLEVTNATSWTNSASIKLSS